MFLRCGSQSSVYGSTVRIFALFFVLLSFFVVVLGVLWAFSSCVFVRRGSMSPLVFFGGCVAGGVTPPFRLQKFFFGFVVWVVDKVRFRWYNLNVM